MARKRTPTAKEYTGASEWKGIRSAAEVLLAEVAAAPGPVTADDYLDHVLREGAEIELNGQRLAPRAGPDPWDAAEVLRVRLRQYIREHGPAIHVRLPGAPVEHVLHLLNRDLADVLHGADDLGHGRELVDVANLLRTIVGEVEDYTLTAAEVAARWGTSRIQDVYEARDLLWRHDPTTGQKRYSVSSARKVGEARLNKKAARETTVDRYQARKPVIGRNEKTTA